MSDKSRRGGGSRPRKTTSKLLFSFFLSSFTATRKREDDARFLHPSIDRQGDLNAPPRATNVRTSSAWAAQRASKRPTEKEERRKLRATADERGGEGNNDGAVSVAISLSLPFQALFFSPETHSRSRLRETVTRAFLPFSFSSQTSSFPPGSFSLFLFLGPFPSLLLVRANQTYVAGRGKIIKERPSSEREERRRSTISERSVLNLASDISFSSFSPASNGPD